MTWLQLPPALALSDNSPVNCLQYLISEPRNLLGCNVWSGAFQLRSLPLSSAAQVPSNFCRNSSLIQCMGSAHKNTWNRAQGEISEESCRITGMDSSRKNWSGYAREYTIHTTRQTPIRHAVVVSY